mgnify:FL=1
MLIESRDATQNLTGYISTSFVEIDSLNMQRVLTFDTQDNANTALTYLSSTDANSVFYMRKQI